MDNNDRTNSFVKTSPFIKVAMIAFILVAATGATLAILGATGTLHLSETVQLVSALSILLGFPGVPFLWVFEQLVDVALPLD